MKYCVNCGRQIQYPDANFCDSCGHRQPVFGNCQTSASTFAPDKNAGASAQVGVSDKDTAAVKRVIVFVVSAGLALLVCGFATMVVGPLSLVALVGVFIGSRKLLEEMTGIK
jgi:uncharacterized membrane protein YvbJ